MDKYEDGSMQISLFDKPATRPHIFTTYGTVSDTINAEKNDQVNHPSHYTDGKIEVIEYIEDKKLDFCLGNAIKYISRAGKKDKSKTIEDLKKAIWYIEREIKRLEANNETSH